jgi:glycosyltransferase 2 family protein
VLNKKVRERLIFLFKVILSLLSIIYVLNKVRIGDIASLLKSAAKLNLIPALILFVISKWMSASRTLLILNHYSIPVSKWENLKLYWTGMFYNLFLPGGIGGDIYKTVIINKRHKNGIMISAGAVLMDRIAGVTALIVLALLCLHFTDLYHQWGWISYVGIPLTLICFVGFILIFMPGLKGIIGKLLGWSFMVQGFQVLSLIFILNALRIRTDQIEYMLIFLISSVAAMLPISVGGIGIRELVFFSISSLLFLDQKVAVTISFTFYLITVLTSLFGIISVLERNRNFKSEIGTQKSVSAIL